MQANTIHYTDGDSAPNSLLALLALAGPGSHTSWTSDLIKHRNKRRSTVQRWWADSRYRVMLWRVQCLEPGKVGPTTVAYGWTRTEEDEQPSLVIWDRAKKLGRSAALQANKRFSS